MTPADLTPGTRVAVQHSGHPSGQAGVVVAMPPRLLNGHDAAVMLDGDEWPLCFYAHELAVES